MPCGFPLHLGLRKQLNITHVLKSLHSFGMYIHNFLLMHTCTMSKSIFCIICLVKLSRLGFCCWGRLNNTLGVSVLEFGEALVQPLTEGVHFLFVHANGCCSGKVGTRVIITVSPPVDESVTPYRLASRSNHPEKKSRNLHV